MIHLNPYLFFNGNCKQAMTFYKDALDAELEMQTIGESPMASQMPPEMKDKIMHSTLRKNNAVLFMASDMMGPEGPRQGNTISLSLTGDTKGDIETIFQNLSEGGNVTQPLKEEFFGTYGDLVDKFGIRWMFEVDKPKQ